MRNPVRAWQSGRSRFPLHSLLGDPIWAVSVLASLALNLAVLYGYAQTLENGSWNKPLICPRKCTDPMPAIRMTLEEAEMVLPPPPEIKAEETKVRVETPPSPRPEPLAAMSPVVVPSADRTPPELTAEIPLPPVLSPIYVQQPAENLAPDMGQETTLEAPPIAAQLPPGYVPWASDIREAGANLRTALTASGQLYISPGATGGGFGASQTGSSSPERGQGGSGGPIASIAAPPPPAPVSQPAPPRPPAPTEAPKQPEKPKGPTAPPKLIHRVEPDYPASAKKQGIEGVVILRILVSAEGEVADASVTASSGQTVLDESALEAVRKWEFSPGLQDGQPKEQYLKVRVSFRIVD
jgi:protein TonB